MIISPFFASIDNPFKAEAKWSHIRLNRFGEAAKERSNYNWLKRSRNAFDFVGVSICGGGFCG
ncbi:hypothetical protein AGMMS50229_12790 [Campylobacterota bacterium]|nr:hypothetical protein AGMMS50229_12790 [Campylobacterota bacterium]